MEDPYGGKNLLFSDFLYGVDNASQRRRSQAMILVPAGVLCGQPTRPEIPRLSIVSSDAPPNSKDWRQGAEISHLWPRAKTREKKERRINDRQEQTG